ncbi:MAG TPA: hypothetical protein PK560_08275, partial [bacterium]|nr:hypothetical protein [bacterium]
MKKIIISVLVLIMFFACTEKKVEKKEVLDSVTKTISASEGGEIATEDGEGKIEIPAGALEKDTEITMTRYKKDGFPEKDDLISKPFEFAPAGLKFKKDISVTIKADTGLTKIPAGKRVAAGLLNDSGSDWLHEGSGDPIMSGDP